MKKSSAFKKPTLKSRRESLRYIKRFLKKGNRKLVDSEKKLSEMEENEYKRIKKFIDDPENGIFRARFAQFNLPAKITCPFASAACLKFCYAKRDERYPSVKNSRLENLAAAKSADFSENMIYTIETELDSKRFNGSNTIMILRIHESGDFFNMRYLESWIEVFYHFIDCKKVVFEFYTKCFDYFLNLDSKYTSMLQACMNQSIVGMNISLDDSMPMETKFKAIKVAAKFPKANYYYCAEAEAIENANCDQICNCEKCAECSKCVFTEGKKTGVIIH